jgi:hypothetical protein
MESDRFDGENQLMNQADLEVILAKLHADWFATIWPFTTLLDTVEMTGEDAASLTRNFHTRTIELPEGPWFEFAWALPPELLETRLDWTLKWPDAGSFSNPLGFSESDYDTDTMKIDGLDWDAPTLPRSAFANAAETIDWYTVFEYYDEQHLESREADLSVFPAILRPIAKEGLEIFRAGRPCDHLDWKNLVDRFAK